MKACAQLKFRDIISETVSEFSRKGNFVRIFPARNSKLYDKYFGGQKPLNKIIYKVLFSNEVLSYTRGGEKSVIPSSAKQTGLISGVSSSSVAGRQSQDRLNSASGVRPIRKSASKSKLMGQEERK